MTGERITAELGRPARALRPLSDGPLGDALRALRRTIARLTQGRAVEEALRRKTAEAEALRTRAQEAEHIIRLMENLAGVGFWRLEPRTRARSWSCSMYRIFGLDPGLGPPIDGVLDAFDADHHDQLRRVIGGLAPDTKSDNEYRITRGDGRRGYIRMVGAVERDAAGDVSHLYGAIVDVTQAKLRELALADSEARYRLLADSVHDVILRIGVDGSIEYVSPSVRQLGYEPGAVTGRNIADFLGAAAVEEIRASLATYVAGDPFPDDDRSELAVQRSDGSSVWMESLAAGVYHEGQFVGVVTVLRDIGERRALEDELRRKTADAEAAVLAKSEFLANVSHEVRTPLTAIVGYAGLIAATPDLPESVRTYVDRVVKSGEALHAIVDDILDFSKVEANRIVLKLEPCRLATLLADVAGQVRATAEAKGLWLTTELDAPGVEAVQVDRMRLGQVIGNLLANAVKFTPAGGVTLSARYDDATQQLEVSVRDTGIGIAPDQAHRLFQRFSQVEASNARRFGGVGLGLAISKGLVELMGGEITCRSEAGAGSTFRFRIPATAIATAAPAAPPAEADTAADLPPLRVLVVDDAALNRELLAALLAPFAADIVEAADGAEAVAAAGREAFDLVLMDVQMPEMDGLAATRTIRAGSPLNAATPIIAVSASVLPEEVQACLEAGMNDHVPKPISPHALMTKIAAWTGAERRSGYAA